MRLVIFALFTLIAALRPLETRGAVFTTTTSFPGWPAELLSDTFHEVELSEREAQFSKDFPGRVAKFSDGQRDYIVRWILKESRKLHPAADCLRGAGFAVHPLPIRKDARGSQWGCALARREQLELKVCEQIKDQAGESWSDVSAWFWAAALQQSEGPWWAVSIIEHM